MEAYKTLYSSVLFPAVYLVFWIIGLFSFGVEFKVSFWVYKDFFAGSSIITNLLVYVVMMHTVCYD